MNQPTLELYGWNTPNGQKITIALEEVGADYLYHLIDISNGEQHAESFKLISPDGKIPALIHHTESTVTLFESGAILLYLADLFPAIHGKNSVERAQVMSWTFWQVGQLGPFAGQFGRFQTATPKNPAAVEHFEQLVWRCLNVLEKQLTQSDFLAADHFTVADIASITWVASNQSYLQKFGIKWREKCPAVTRWADVLFAKASVKKALKI